MTLTELEKKLLKEISEQLNPEPESIQKAYEDRAITHELGFKKVNINGKDFIPKDRNKIGLLMQLYEQCVNLRLDAEYYLQIKDIE